jgi:hypothetical protein
MREEAGPRLLAVGVVAFVMIALSACVTMTRTILVTAADNSDCVVLLHGLNRSYRAMAKMAAGLQEAGFATANVDYPSQTATVEGLAHLAVNEGLEKCRQTNPRQIHFVTHSIGGILLRYVQDEAPIPELGRVVMLAPPNQGSEIVDLTRNWPTARLFSGKAGLQLGTDKNSIPSKLGVVDFDLGIVAGTGTINPIFSAMLHGPDDGKVTVESTKVEGMSDFLIVNNSHHTIGTSDVVIENTIAFLRNGRFLTSTVANGAVFLP